MADHRITILPARQRRITPEQAGAAYDILIEHAGAHNDDRGNARESFILAVSHPKIACDEYRFCGSLGFGGKFRNNGNRDGVPHVDCYREHETAERVATIEKVNALLRDLFDTEARHG